MGGTEFGNTIGMKAKRKAERSEELKVKRREDLKEFSSVSRTFRRMKAGPSTRLQMLLVSQMRIEHC